MQFPDLSRTPFTSVRAHIIREAFASFEPKLAARLRAVFAGKGFSGSCRETSTSGQTYEFAIAWETFADEFELDLEVRPDTTEELKNILSSDAVDEALRGQDAADEEFQARLRDLQELYGVELIVEATCGFSVRASDLPNGGIVRRGLGAKANFHEDTLRLAGAQFAVNGRMEQTISWYVDPYRPDWESIEGAVFSLEEMEFGPDILAEIVQVAQQRFERYILETGPSIVP